MKWDEDFRYSGGDICFGGAGFTKWVRRACPQMKDAPLFRVGEHIRGSERTEIAPGEHFYVRELPCRQWLAMNPAKYVEGCRELGHVQFDAVVPIPVLGFGSGTAIYETLMGLTPSEMFTLRPGLRKARGRVLVGGLGLGWFARRVLERKQVKHVTVVELSPEMARLFGGPLRERFGERLEVVVGDVYAHAKRRLRKFDSILIDIWAGQNLAGEDAEFHRLRVKHANVWGWGW